MTQPAYFETIRQDSVRVWETLQDPVIAGPWHQLFKQVQSPRHVLSELLQNADDAGATRAAVRIEDDAFIFEHNGEDFCEEHFRSLCRFGYSNKRALHTIGFRGVGFKSTFSLGDVVELYTPSLAVCFHASRWTEPQPARSHHDTGGWTRVRVGLKDQQRKREIERNLQEWVASPVSLIFFKSLRSITIGDVELCWEPAGAGPVPSSHWIALGDGGIGNLLLLRSDDEPFPDEALEEIRLERMINLPEETNFPPCRVEIILHAEGRLYVVLPTGVHTKLPFACNAPFIQDPARLKIKDPETSPTNRWLLERVGKLAASSMLSWLHNDALTNDERARAYDLMPDVELDDNSLEGVCASAVQESFAAHVQTQPLLLTHTGKLTPAMQSVCLPDGIGEVWDPVSAAGFFDRDQRPPLSEHVSAANIQKLSDWSLIERIEPRLVILKLQLSHLPKPKTWRSLLKLWAFTKPHVSAYYPRVEAAELAINPVQGRDTLHKASEVVRIGEKRLLQSDDDWQFLSKYFLVLDQRWPRFLAEQRRDAEERRDEALAREVESAYFVLERAKLVEASDIDQLILRSASAVFRSKDLALEDCIRLTQIAAKLGAHLDDSYRYCTRDGRRKSCANTILFDADGCLEPLLPKGSRDAQLLHPEYTRHFRSCTEDEWLKWVKSDRSQLHTFIPLKARSIEFHGKHKIELEAKKRGLSEPLSFPYKPPHFLVDDWDFDDSVWEHWESLAREDRLLWATILEAILSQKESFWNKSKNARLFQVASTGTKGPMTNEAAPATWILKLRKLPCVRDTRGQLRLPSEVLRRTDATEPLLDVEFFIDRKWDTEANRGLLDLLGVSGVPLGPDKLLDCLRSLARSPKPPAQEVEKWCRRLDQMLDHCSTEEVQKVRSAFHSEKLIWALDGAAGLWTNASSVFQTSSDDDVPGVPVIRPAVADLALWRRIGVPERPTVELALAWLKRLPVSHPLSAEDLKRARGMIGRFPRQIWDDLRHWLNLLGEWVPVESLSYGLSMQSLVRWQHLHPWVKRHAANLQLLSAEQVGHVPFSRLPSLASLLEERLSSACPQPSKRPQPAWLAAFVDDLIRVEWGEEETTTKVRDLSLRLRESSYVEIPGLEVTPYLDGKPAGTPRNAEVAWLDSSLCVNRLSAAKLAKAIPDELGKIFGHTEIKAALDFSVGRPAGDIHAYFAENFKLADVVPSMPARTQIPPPAPQPPPPVDPPAAASTPEPDQRAAAPVAEPLPIEPVQHPTPEADRRSRVPNPALFERFAAGCGFTKDRDGNFRHEDGRRLMRLRDDIFPWGIYSPGGHLERRFWVQDICMDDHPVHIEAEVWSMVERTAETVSLVLKAADGRPQEMPANILVEMRQRGIVALHPATYRLVKTHDA